MSDTSRPQDASDHHPVVAATPARQGRLGRPVFWVLVISTFLAAVALAVAWSWYAPGLAGPGSQERVNSPPGAATATDAPAPAPRTP